MKTAREVACDVLRQAGAIEYTRTVRLSEAVSVVEADRASHAAELREAVDLLRRWQRWRQDGTEALRLDTDAWLARNPGGDR
jgi:hypothetical protein